MTWNCKARLHEYRVLNPDSNLNHNPHGKGGLSLDLNPVCFRVNATNLDQDPDQNPRVNRATVGSSLHDSGADLGSEKGGLFFERQL